MPELTDLQKQQIETIMLRNPVLDYLIAETMVTLPEDDLREIVEKHKKGELKDDGVPKHTEYVLKTGKVLVEE